MILHKDHCACDEVKTVTSTTYRQLENDGIVCNDGILNEFDCTWNNITSSLCLPVSYNQWSSSADPPAGHCLSYSTGAILAVTESQCHSYATSSVLTCYKTLFVHPPLFNAATSNHRSAILCAPCADVQTTGRHMFVYVVACVPILSEEGQAW